jgi:hypothetical protein
MLRVVVPPADATVTSVNVNVPVAGRGPAALQMVMMPVSVGRPKATAGVIAATSTASRIFHATRVMTRGREETCVRGALWSGAGCGRYPGEPRQGHRRDPAVAAERGQTAVLRRFGEWQRKVPGPREVLTSSGGQSGPRKTLPRLRTFLPRQGCRQSRYRSQLDEGPVLGDPSVRPTRAPRRCRSVDQPKRAVLRG